MKYFPAASRIAFESPPCLLPAAGGCGVVRRRGAAEDERVLLPMVDELFPGALRLGAGPRLRVRP